MTGLRRFGRWLRGAGRQPAADANPAAVPDDFDRVKANWQALGRHDPLWAIVSVPDKRGNRWDPAEFMATGAMEVKHVMNALDRLELQVKRDRALDFGAGVGRLTQALADHFREVDGVDISTPMIEQARSVNRHGDRVRYHLGEDDRLPFDDAQFDFVLSRIVLQHVGIEHQRRYVREFIRVLKPGGLAVFQAPTRSLVQEGDRFESPVETPEGTVTIDMNMFPRVEVERALQEAGGRLLHALEDRSAGEGFESLVYVAAR